MSGSPAADAPRAHGKLRLDGIAFDEFILKPNLRNLLTGRFRALREQVGYKLPALLTGRAGVTRSARAVCFGDDAGSMRLYIRCTAIFWPAASADRSWILRAPAPIPMTPATVALFEVGVSEPAAARHFRGTEPS